MASNSDYVTVNTPGNSSPSSTRSKRHYAYPRGASKATYADLSAARDQNASIFEVHMTSFIIIGLGVLFLTAFVLIPKLEERADTSRIQYPDGNAPLDFDNHHIVKRGVELVAIPPPPPADEIRAKLNKESEQGKVLHAGDEASILAKQRERVADLINQVGAEHDLSERKEVKHQEQKNAGLAEGANQAPKAPAALKRFRDDGRCGPNFPAPGALEFGECDPNGNADQKGPCCNPKSGYCGNIRGPSWGHCPPKCRDCRDYTPGGFTGPPPAAQRPAAKQEPMEAFKFAESKMNATPPEGSRLTQDIGRKFIKDLPADASDAEKENFKRREFVKGMMKSAWKGYADSGWGSNELMPKAKKGHSAGIFGVTKMGATIVDALDTLMIMGLDDEVKAARKWIEESLHFDVDASVSVFEVTIRFVGGLLSAFAMSGDVLYKNKALELAVRLLPAFKTPTGIPMAQVNLVTEAIKNWGWSSGKCSILSEFGTMQMEWEYLSLVTGDMRFADHIRHVTKFVIAKVPDDGLYPNYLNPKTGNWGSKHISMGALGDSFYEYLLKMWVYHGGRNNPGIEVDAFGRGAFDNSMQAVQKSLVQRSKDNFIYLCDLKNGRKVAKMGHLACFMGGLYALGIKGASPELAKIYKENAEGITATCYEGYNRAEAKLGPESMMFGGANEFTATKAKERYYILRPETVEAYFYNWRLTKDQKYRDWAWEAAQAIEKNCRCGDNGYCGIKDVNGKPLVQDDVQQSFFLAETLKYLYLIFCDDDVISLDLWVLNTEAHPMPIQNYRK